MNKTTEALKLAEEALNAMLTHMGIDEDEWTKPTFNQAREALAAIREASAETVKQKPVAWGEVVLREGDVTVSGYLYGQLPVGTKLYTTPPTYASLAALAARQMRDAAVQVVYRFINGDGLAEPFMSDIAEAIEALPIPDEMNDKQQQVVAWAYIDADGKFMDALDHQHGAYQTPLCKCVPDLDQILHDPENQPSQYGTVPMDYPERAARQMRDAAVNVLRELEEQCKDGSCGYVASEAIAALPIPGEEK